MHPKGTKEKTGETYVQIFMAVLFMMAKDFKPPKWSTIGKRIK